jgi:hypothetical protein
MSFGEQDGNSTGGCHMCLAMPGKIIEISPENPASAEEVRGYGIESSETKPPA